MTQYKNSFLTSFILAIGLVFTSCESEELVTTTPEFSDEEIMAMLQTDLTSRSNGMVLDIQHIAEELVKIIGQEAYCDAPYEFNIEDGNTGDFFEISYSGQVKGEVTCLRNLPIAATVFATASSRLTPVSREGLVFTGASVFEGAVAAFFDPISFFPIELETGVKISGNYNRVGTAMSDNESGPKKIGTNLSIDLTEFTATVFPEADIDAGIGTLTFTGSVDGEQVFSLDGSLVFHGDKSLTLTINGEAFPWSWE